MSEMPNTCVICKTHKHPDLMLFSDTCKACSNGFRRCSDCQNNSVASTWEDGACPRCTMKSTSGMAYGDHDSHMTHGEVTDLRATNSKPQIIGTLSTLGWMLFALMVLSGIIALGSEMGVLGIALIVSGVFQLSIFLGFSAIIDQLYKINVNTSKPDKSDT